MAETANTPTAAAKTPPVDDKPKSGSMHTETVKRVTGAFDVTKPADLEEAAAIFVSLAKKNGVTIDGDPRLVKVNHRVGFFAEYTFEGKVK